MMVDTHDLLDLQKEVVKQLEDDLRKAKEALRDIEHKAYLERPACEGYKWMGQSFKFCDDCGKPYWEHTHDSRWEKGQVVLIPITPEQAAACKAKWGDNDDEG